MNDNFQSRRWILVLNNPQNYNMNHDAIIDLLLLFNPNYFCLSDEIAKTGTPHTHIYLYSTSPIRYCTVKNRFPTAHIERAAGTSLENRSYIRKEDKWEKTDKSETIVEGSFFEFGKLPSPQEEKSPKQFYLLEAVKDGKRTTEIINDNPGLAFKIRDIDLLRDTLFSERFMKEIRDVKVLYVYGETGSGKTRGIFERHKPEEICRITSYAEKGGVKFDAYHGQKVLVFEEFHSQIPIADMLSYLDVYPLNLPARYSDRVACFDTVYITSNIPLNKQYQEIQKLDKETWKAFLRRIDTVLEYRKNGTVSEKNFNATGIVAERN